MVVQAPQMRRSLPLVAVPSDPIWRLSIDQYHQMIRIGILTDDDRVELLEGWLVTQMPKDPPHRLSTQLTREVVARLLPAAWHVQDQEPITVADSEPEPDVAVIAGERRDYASRHPSAQEIALVIEVSDTTLQRDQTLKKQVYARAGIGIYWIINLPQQQLEVYTLPFADDQGADYQQCSIYTSNESVPLVVDDRAVGNIVVRDLLP
ncbi:MAG: Uma2 family endonuclease [Roseiflexaceae bacterium]|nr:Uma2 family endonuclease [Roseiflexaceae bacterium]